MVHLDSVERRSTLRGGATGLTGTVVQPAALASLAVVIEVFARELPTGLT
jgi:hypothetical protein